MRHELGIWLDKMLEAQVSEVSDKADATILFLLYIGRHEACWL